MSQDKLPPGININALKQEIIAKLNIPAFYRAYISGPSDNLDKARQDGWSERVLCPIHNDSEPNFFINVRTGQFKCHAAQCKAGGSAFDFWLNRNGYSTADGRDLVKALLALANEAGVAIRGVSPGKVPPNTSPEAVQKVADANAIPKRPTTAELDAKAKPIPKSLYREFIKHLEPLHFKYLAQSRGLTKETIATWEIGWNPSARVKDRNGQFQSGRLTLPVLDSNGDCRNIRQHSSVAANAKMVNFVVDKGAPTEKGYGDPARLFGLCFLKQHHEHVVICEGEFDCILLNQHFEEAKLHTWRAVTGTHGASKFMPEWVDDLKDKHVYLCLDCDPPGQAAAADIATKFLLSALQQQRIKSLRIVTLPMEGTKELKDITDWFVKVQATTDQFLQLCLNTPETILGGTSQDDASIAAIDVDSLDTVLRERQYIDRKVKVPLTIVSSAEKIYHAIRTYKVTACPIQQKPEGECCSLSSGNRYIPYGHPLFIESCLERESNIFNRLRQIACQRDEKCTIEAIQKVVMEQYFAHQVMERQHLGLNEDMSVANSAPSMDQTYVAIYFLQPEERIQVEPKNYMATGWVRTHPKTCVATLFVEYMEPMEDDFRKFNLQDQEVQKALKTLQTDFTVDTLMEEITKHITRIYHSDEILYAVLLTYLSPQYFVFNGAMQRGWISTLIFGDSGVGKSATYVRFSDWVEIGAWFSCLTGSRTGLVYAQKKKNEEWFTSAGEYVRQSGKIIGVDEVQVLDKDDTRSLAGGIDRGYIEIKKVSSGGFECRTRAIFIGNPVDLFQKQAVLSDFPHGCECLINTFDPMFIRRMDMAVFRSRREEFDYNAYVSPDQEKTDPCKLTPGMMKALIYWAWTRDPKHIIFDEQATRFCLVRAGEMSALFGEADKVPLVNPNDFRETLARVSVAWAILARNFSEDLTSVIVTDKHCHAASRLLHVIYSSEDCNLLDLSRQMGRMNRLVDFDGVRKYVENFLKEDSVHTYAAYRETFPSIRLLLLLQSVGSIALHEVGAALGVDSHWVRRRCIQLQSIGMIRPGERNKMMPTRKFNLFMMKWRDSSPDIEKKLDEVYRLAADYASRRQEEVGLEDQSFPRKENQEAESAGEQPF